MRRTQGWSTLHVLGSSGLHAVTAHHAAAAVRWIGDKRVNLQAELLQ